MKVHCRLDCSFRGFICIATYKVASVVNSCLNYRNYNQFVSLVYTTSQKRLMRHI